MAYISNNILIFRHEQGPDHEIVPRYDDRLVLDRVLRTRLGPGGKNCLLFSKDNCFVNFSLI